MTMCDYVVIEGKANWLPDKQALNVQGLISLI